MLLTVQMSLWSSREKKGLFGEYRLHTWSHVKCTTACVVGMMAILKGEETKAQKMSNHLQEFTKLIDDIAGMI